MVVNISEVIEDHTLKAMKESNHQALLVTEQLAIHGFIQKSTGEFKSHYLKVVGVLQPEVSNTESSTDTDQDTCISVGAQIITNHVCEFTDE